MSACSSNLNRHPLDELRIDIGYEPSSLDPQYLTERASARVSNDLFAGLMDFDQNNNPIAGLAESWSVSKNGKIYIFHLRAGIKFSDATPITADDVVFSWQRLANPKTGAPFAYLLNSLENGSEVVKGLKPVSALGVTALDESTVVVKLKQSTPEFLEYLTLPAFSILPKHTLDKYNTSWTKPHYLVSSGAYKLVEHVFNSYILVKKNPYYYESSQIVIPSVRFLIFHDRNAAFNAYRTGSLDILFSLPTNNISQIMRDYSKEIYRSNYETLVYYDFNLQNPIFESNLKLRQALSMAIDRETLVNKIIIDEIRMPLYSTVTPTIADGVYADIHYAWESWPRIEQIKYAKQLYKEAGYDKAHPLVISILYNSDEGNKKRTLALASMWQETLGIKVNVQQQEWKTFINSRQKGNFDISRDGSSAAYNAVDVYANLYACKSKLNNSHYCNKEYDKLIKLADSATDVKTEQLYYHKALELALSDYPIIPLYQPSYSRLVKPYINNYQIEENYLDQVQSKWLSWN